MFHSGDIRPLVTDQERSAIKGVGSHFSKIGSEKATAKSAKGKQSRYYSHASPRHALLPCILFPLSQRGAWSGSE